MGDTQEFQTGDIVQLRSGGPKMTVEHMGAAGGTVRCQWFSGKKPAWGDFPFKSLARPKEAENKP